MSLDTFSVDISKDYQHQKEVISRFKKIIVTGPHGSGTKIASKIIAHDFPNLSFIKGEGRGHSDLLLKTLLTELAEKTWVMFCPSCSGHIHRITNSLRDILVVFMYKDITEIREYKKRNNIVAFIENYEIPVYENILKENPHIHHTNYPNTIEGMTYAAWEGLQRKTIPNWIDISHSSLSTHPLFIQKTDRKDFKEWQTSLI